MQRVVAFVGTVIGLVIGVAALVHWASHHLPTALIITVGCVPYAFALTRLVPKPMPTASRIQKLGWGYGLKADLIQLGLVVALALAGALAEKSYTWSFMYALVGLVPLAWLTHRYDQRTHKTCPECAERIQLAATVCRYCQYRYPQPFIA